MEGNACYRYRTVRRYLARHSLPPVESVLDIGANVGDIAAELLDAFPACRVHCFEIIPALICALRARFRTRREVTIHHAAVTSAPAVTVWQAKPGAGPGWRGGSLALPEGQAANATHYAPLPAHVTAADLNAIVAELGPVDFLKSDCEGAETDFLLAATPDTLRQIRFLAGEYHGLARFYPAACALRLTHRVAIVGERNLGSFFAERTDETPGLLCPSLLRARIYPALVPDTPLTWHPFNPAEIPAAEWHAHGIMGRSCCK